MQPTTAAAILARNVSTIALLESAGKCFKDVRQAVELIERAINRPLPPVECGPCPTISEDQKRCAVGLSAKRGEIEVLCWKCKTTYNIAELIQMRLDSVPNLMFTAKDVLKIMGQIGEPISDRTWRFWRAEGKIQPQGELYGDPGYLLEEVRELRRNSRRREMAS